MFKRSKFRWLACLIAAVVALTAAVTAFLFYKEKKRKEDEQLEEYLDYSIQ